MRSCAGTSGERASSRSRLLGLVTAGSAKTGDREQRAALANHPSWQCFGILVNGEVAGVGSMFVRDRAACFGIEATWPAFRDRSIQRSIVVAQISAAAAAGATILTCEASQPADPADKAFSSYRNQ